MDGSWIKIHRKLKDSPIMKHAGLARLWLYCLLTANWRDSKWLVPGTTSEVVVPRGSFITGRHSLHEKLYGSEYSGDKNEIPSELTLWRWLKGLEKMGCISVLNMNNRCSMVTICKYSTYQKREEPQCPTDEQPVNNRRTTDEQLMNTSKEYNNPRREEFNTSGFTGSEKTKEPEEEALPPLREGRLMFDATMLPLPDVLQTPQFKDSWSKWCNYLTAEKGTRLAQTTAAHQLADLARDGPAVASQRILASMQNGWIKLAETPKTTPLPSKTGTRKQIHIRPDEIPF